MAIIKILNGISGEEAANTIYENDIENANKIDAVEQRLPATVQGKNLFNPANILIDKYQSSNPATGVTNGAGWACSGYIPVTAGDYYLSSDKSRVGLGFYSPTKSVLRYVGLNTGKFTVQAGEAFVVFNLKSPAEPNWSWAQLERGSVPTAYVPYKPAVVAATSIEGLPEVIAQTAEQQDRIDELDVLDVTLDESDNILNPATLVDKTLVSGAGGGIISGTPTTDLYATTGFIPVEPQQLYSVVRRDGSTALLARQHAFYNASKVFISGGQTDVGSFTSPVGAAFVRFSVGNASHGSGTALENYAFFKGPARPFEPYGLEVLITIDAAEPDNKPDNALATMADVRAGSSVQPTAGKLEYKLNANVLELRVGENLLTFLTASARGFTGNDMINFNNYSIFGASSSTGDDAAPIHMTGTTLGANHGQPHNIANIPAHGLDNTAIGTGWLHTNGTTYYVVRIVDANNVAFLSDNIGTFESPLFSAIPAGSISRSGVTLTISNINSTQLYPSIKNLSIKIYDDQGVEIPRGTSGRGHFLRMVESYEVMYVPDILDNLKARAGQAGPPVFEGRSICRINIVYHITDNLTTVVAHTFEPLMEVAFADIMVTQAIPLRASVSTTAYYIPNSAQINASVDLRKPTIIPWGAGIPSTFTTVANSPDPTNPPNRVAMYNGDAGFLIGMLKDRGVGANLADYTLRTFEIRSNTGKIYPHPIEGGKVGSPAAIRKAYSSVLFRAWSDLSKTRTASRISLFDFDFDGATYVYADYSDSTVDRIDLGRPDLQGKRIEVLEQVNAELQTPVYAGEIVVTVDYVEGETAFAVIKIY